MISYFRDFFDIGFKRVFEEASIPLVLFPRDWNPILSWEACWVAWTVILLLSMTIIWGTFFWLCDWVIVFFSVSYSFMALFSKETRFSLETGFFSDLSFRIYFLLMVIIISLLRLGLKLLSWMIDLLLT